MRQLKSLVLPFTALVVIPGLILVVAQKTVFGVHLYLPALQVPAGALVCAMGLTLMVITIRMLVLLGRGTLAPWDPTSRLVTDGIYGHVRNPMIAGVLGVLLGEALLLGSLGVLIWGVLFFVVNTLYFHYSEEPGLGERFGEEYLEYKRHVPMWLPRLSRWEKNGTQEP